MRVSLCVRGVKCYWEEEEGGGWEEMGRDPMQNFQAVP